MKVQFFAPLHMAVVMASLAADPVILWSLDGLCNQQTNLPVTLLHLSDVV